MNINIISNAYTKIEILAFLFDKIVTISYYSRSKALVGFSFEGRTRYIKAEAIAKNFETFYVLNIKK